MLNMGMNIVMGLLLAPVFIHQLGNEVYGVWVLAVSFSVVRGALGIFDLGISGSLVKYVAEYHARGEHDKVNESFSAALIVYLVIGGLVAVGVTLFALSPGVNVFQVPSSQLETLRVLLLILAVQTLIDLPALSVFGLLEGIQRYDITRWFNIARIFTFALLSLAFLVLGAGVYALALATFVSELVRLVGQSYWAARLLPALRIRLHVSRSVLRGMFALSAKLFVFLLASTIYNQMDQIIIATRLNTNLLTDYDISFRLHTLVFAFGTLIGPFVLPAASALNALNDRVELHRLLVRATRYTGVLTVPVAMITIVLAEPLTALWIGPEYLHTVPATRLFISYLLYWSLLRSGQNMLIGINRLQVILPAFLLSVAVNLLISVIAAPTLGVSGVILGTVISNALIFVLYMATFQDEFGLTLRDLWRQIFLPVYPHAVAGALVVGLLFSWQTPASLLTLGLYAIMGLGVFGVLFFLTGMPIDERTVLVRYLKTRIRRNPAH